MPRSLSVRFSLPAVRSLWLLSYELLTSRLVVTRFDDMCVLDQLFFRPRGGVLESRLHEGRKRMHLGVLVGCLQHRFDLGFHLGGFNPAAAICPR